MLIAVVDMVATLVVTQSVMVCFVCRGVNPFPVLVLVGLLPSKHTVTGNLPPDIDHLHPPDSLLPGIAIRRIPAGKFAQVPPPLPARHARLVRLGGQHLAHHQGVAAVALHPEVARLQVAHLGGMVQQVVAGHELHVKPLQVVGKVVGQGAEVGREGEDGDVGQRAHGGRDQGLVVGELLAPKERSEHARRALEKELVCGIGWRGGAFVQ